MTLYVVNVDPNDDCNLPFNYGVYSTEQKAIDAIYTAAIEKGEPAILLDDEFDSFLAATCYHYPDYEYSRYYIEQFELDET